jgi:hypothetical protein
MNKLEKKPNCGKAWLPITRGDIQLPGSAFANVCAFGYLSSKQTSQRYGTATKYTANVVRKPIKVSLL